MGQFFSDSVERALKYIYYDLRSQRGAEGFRLLEQAVNAGDADACCLLARCLYGPEYTWPGHRFPTDEKAGDELMRRSVLEGSAIGTLLSLRCGVMNRQLAQAMPLSFQEAFDIVLDKAEHGEPLCQMIIGNAYYWGDFPEIQGKAREDFDSDDAVQSYLRENYAKCEDWLWRSLRSGISTGGVNLANFYREGKAGSSLPGRRRPLRCTAMGRRRGIPVTSSTMLMNFMTKGKRERPLSSTAVQRRRGSPGPSSGRATPMSWEMGFLRMPPGQPNITSRRWRRLSTKR